MKVGSCSTISAIAAALVVQAGCAATHLADDKHSVDPGLSALVEHSPARVGVHYSPGVRPFVLRSGHARLPIGDDVASMFDWSLRQVFFEVVEVTALPPSHPVPEGIAGIIVLTQLRYEPAREPTPDAVGMVPAPRLIYSIEWRDREGQVLDQWEASGTAIEGAARALAHWLIRDATASFLLSLPEHDSMQALMGGPMVTADSTDRARAALPKAARTGPVVAILPTSMNWSTNETQAERCIRERLESRAPSVRVIPFDRLRRMFYPWLERSTMPEYDADLRKVLQRHNVAEKMDQLNVRYLLHVAGQTSTSFDKGGGACGYGGCLGLLWGARESSYYATLIELTPEATVTPLSSGKRTGAFMPLVGLPIPIVAATKGPACDELANAIRAMVTAKGPETSKAP